MFVPHTFAVYVSVYSYMGSSNMINSEKESTLPNKALLSIINLVFPPMQSFHESVFLSPTV